MATTLYATNVVSDLVIASHTVFAMSLSRGSGVQTITNSGSGASNVQVKDLANNFPVYFAYRVGAFTLSANSLTNINHWGSESNLSSNYGAGIGAMYRQPSPGTDFTLTKVVSSEYGTSPSAMTNASVTYSSVAFSNGDYLVIAPYHLQVAAGVAGSLTFSYAGTSAGADGDTFWTFSDNIPVFNPTISGSFTGDGEVTTVGRAVWTTPTDTSNIGTLPVLAFTMPSSRDKSMHFEMQIDTVNTFDSGSLRIIRSVVSQTGWEYFNGTSFVAVPSTGVPKANSGNAARYTVQSALTGGTTYYRRVRTVGI